MMTTILGNLFSTLLPYILPVLGAFAAFFFAKRKGKKEERELIQRRTMQDYAVMLETNDEITKDIVVTPADHRRERLREFANN